MMSHKFKQASAADFELHKPIEWPLYDQAGLLLLKQGYVITMPKLIDRLLERGCYIGPPNTEEKRVVITPANGTEARGRERVDEDNGINPRKAVQSPVFFRATDLITSVRRIHKLLCETPSPRMDVKDYIVDRAKTLIALLDEDPDAVLASACLSTETLDYRPGQQLLGAAIAALLAPACGIEANQRLPLVCAALTRDVGLSEFDKISGNFTRGLPDMARVTVAEHTALSVRLLTTHGVTDPDWLSYVMEHHERPDGKGYPAGKKTGAALPGSFLLNLADSYASMVLPSERAPGKFPANALKELFLEKGARYDERHIAFLFKVLTRFPPGTLVTLENGEIGLVKKSLAGNSEPTIYSIYDRSGMPRSSPIQRDTRNPEFAITGCISPSKCKSAALVIRRLWQTAK